MYVGIMNWRLRGGGGGEVFTSRCRLTVLLCTINVFNC